MRKIRSSRAIAVLALLSAAMPWPIATESHAETHSSGAFVAHTVRDVEGTVLGGVTIASRGNRLLLNGRLSGLSPGFHGFHVHAAGICDPRASDPGGNIVPFLSAGGHLNPGDTNHGEYAGDLPVLYVTADGEATTATANDRLSAALLFDSDGSAIIIHALPDNYANIPTRYSAAGKAGPDAATRATGDAGGRIACGVFTRA